MENLISIIVTVYNRENYLKECLDSVKNQTYKNFECLIIDDGSTDSSINIINSYLEDTRFKLIASKHVGFPEAKNIGLRNATGDYIIFLDSDDSAYPQWLEFLYDTIVKTGADISTCYYDEYLEGKAKKRDEPAAEFYLTHPLPIAEYSYLKMNTIYHKFCSSYLWNKLVKKELYSDIVFKDQIALSDISEIYKIVDKANKVAQIQLPLIHYRRHLKSMGAETTKKGLDYFIFRANVLADSSSFVWAKYPQSRFVTKMMLASELQRIIKAVGKENYNKYIDRPFFKEVIMSKPKQYLFK